MKLVRRVADRHLRGDARGRRCSVRELELERRQHHDRGHEGARQTLSVSSTASPTDSGGSGGSDSDFCATAKEQSKKLEGELTGAINPSSTPASTKALFTKVDEAYTTLANEAPSDIKPALLTVSGIFHQMDQVFAANGYSSTKALAKLEPIITSAKFKTAVAQLKTWGETHHCTTSG